MIGLDCVVCSATYEADYTGYVCRDDGDVRTELAAAWRLGGTQAAMDIDPDVAQRVIENGPSAMPLDASIRWHDVNWQMLRQEVPIRRTEASIRRRVNAARLRKP